MFQTLLSPLKAKLTANFVSLTVMQVTNYAIPFVIMPYLIKIIGIGYYGKIAFGTSIVYLFSIFTEYSFNLTGTQAVSIHRGDKEELSSLFGAIMTSKLLLLGLTFIIYVPTVILVARHPSELSFYFLAFSTAIGFVLFPAWFLQGMEKMVLITLLNFVAKALSIVLIFIVIRKPSDFIYVLLITGASQVFSGLLGLAIIRTELKISWKFCPLQSILKQLSEGFSLFISTLVGNLYKYMTTIILGLLTTDSVVGQFNIAEKIFAGLKNLFAIFHRAAYPQICVAAKESYTALLRFYVKIFAPFTCLFLVVILSLFVFRKMVIGIFIHDNINEVSHVFLILLVASLVVFINLPAHFTLLSYKFNKSYCTVYVVASVVSLISNFILTQFLGSVGTAISVLLTEVSITVGLYLAIEIRHPDFSLSRSIERLHQLHYEFVNRSKGEDSMVLGADRHASIDSNNHQT